VRNSDDFRIDSTHEVDSIGGDVEDVNFMIGDLFDIEIDVKGFVAN
jgi:hypothetical protein